MKYIYPLTNILFTISKVKSLQLVKVLILCALTLTSLGAFAQGQDVIDIQPKCTLANQPLNLVITRISGNDFNGSTLVTVKGQAIAVNSYTKDQMQITVPASLIATAGTVDIVTTTANKDSQASGLTVVGPLSISSTPGCNRATMTASGAPARGSYRWYRESIGGQPIAGATTSSYTATEARTYYVSIVTPSGCETTRMPVTAVFLQKSFANTEFVKQSYEPGKPGIIKVNSEVIDKGHAVSIKWQSVNAVTGVVTELGVTEAPVLSPASLQIASMPGGDTYFQATIIPNATVCYDESSLFVTSQEIVSLPVELVSFKTQSTEDGVQLSWKTASELDNKGFEVEVSTDGKNFRKIAFVESKVGTTSLTQNYGFLDTKATSGTNYYRLKQIDFDGAFEYSKTVAVNLTLVSSSTVYPTLATSDITVRLASSDEQVTIAVADMAGKQLLTVNNPSERQVVLPVQQLQQGIYFVTVISGTQKEVFRFVKR
ncbi:T9SS type A sorting domain-containing protein [Pontibacter sp. BT731]|uniref:Ig-like domain-containing protein n=1 Tax=Pontibacter coccineus TaxID=3063328 RepID=UPI0026E1B1E9|nr:T9SS type A sorting domain-containing protein [Pontibacter sp. BT731]MDO6390820.1 T9SS type A sorting domain-containing protein [Pontibacter sp. BT731]